MIWDASLKETGIPQMMTSQVKDKRKIGFYRELTKGVDRK
jgi:hypothetical protein